MRKDAGAFFSEPSSGPSNNRRLNWVAAAFDGVCGASWGLGNWALAAGGRPSLTLSLMPPVFACGGFFRAAAKFGQTQGRSQPIAFIATDLAKVGNGRIADNWHIEDNLTPFQELGIAKVKS
jgi:hypothetical protein